MSYIVKNSDEFHEAWHSMKDNIMSAIQEQFQHQEITESDAWVVFCSYAKDGESIANIINRIYR